MKYLLDTDICIFLIRGKSDQLVKKVTSMSIDDLALSSITYSELEYGVAKSSNPEKNSMALQEFVIPFQILPWDSSCAQFYGHIRAYLEKKGRTIGVLDEMIASHALSTQLTLVSNNQKHFSRIPDLKLQNWI
jgi:tRNA(fMet)-specific endonuclease VapC